MEKSYRAIVIGTSVMLLKEYLEPLLSVTGKLGHTLRLIPYVNGVFETGISEVEKLELNEEDERKYIGFAKRKPKYNHIEMKIKIITSLKMEFLRNAAEWRLLREIEAYSRYLKLNKIWVRIMDKRNTQFQPALVLIGADPNDDRM